MRRALSSLLVGGAAASGGGTIKLNWSDCGDSSTHGHITSLSPTSVVLGTKTSLAGKGTIDEAIPAAKYAVVAKEGFIPIFSHAGDACKPGTIKLPAGAGEINMKGFKCPLSPGDAELDLDLTLSASIPAKLARITIVLTAESSSGDKALCVQIKTAPENLIVDQDHPENLIPAIADSEEAVNEDFVEGGTLKLGWKDCGDSSYHAKVTSLTPSTLTIGANTHVVGSGNVDEDVTAGSFTITSKAMVGPAEHLSGDVCKPKTFKLPLGLATITWDGLKCPVAKGPADVNVNVKLAASIPAKLARTTIDLKATSSSGHNLICMEMTTAPQQDATIVV